MQHPDEGTIHAWIDGELSADDAAALEAHLKECAQCSAVVAEARGLVAASSRIVSALDIVPGDVIPKTQARRRPWYLSTQLRAAAAVVIVAGASLLVLRNGGERNMKRAMQASAPTVASPPALQEKEVDQAAPVMAAKPVRIIEPPLAEPSATKALSKKKSTNAPREEAANALEGRVSGVVRTDVAADAAKSVQPLQSPDTIARRRFAASPTSSEAVVTGVATASAARDLKKVRTDSAKNETVYEVGPGVEVTLTDNGELASIMQRAGAQAKERRLTAQAQASAPPPPTAIVAAGAAVAKINAATDSISWTSKLGHAMKLKGPLSKAELEVIRQRLPEDQR